VAIEIIFLFWANKFSACTQIKKDKTTNNSATKVTNFFLFRLILERRVRKLVCINPSSLERIKIYTSYRADYRSAALQGKGIPLGAEGCWFKAES
jgi:hypothetical protein